MTSISATSQVYHLHVMSRLVIGIRLIKVYLVYHHLGRSLAPASSSIYSHSAYTSILPLSYSQVDDLSLYELAIPMSA